jgi:hypothetical protein
MSWYPTDTQANEPHIAVKTFRKMSAIVRWVVLVALVGFAIAAVVGLAVSALVTGIQNGG